MLRMVIAEDEYRIRSGLMELAWEDINIQVYAAENGLEALDLVRRHKPHLLLTDIRMPCMDGLELIELAKTMQPGLKAIILTGYRDFDYAQRAIELNSSAYILKPSSPEEIMCIVEKNAHLIRSEETLKNDKEGVHPLGRVLLRAFAGRADGLRTLDAALRDAYPEPWSFCVAAFRLSSENKDFAFVARQQSESPFAWTMTDNEQIVLALYCLGEDLAGNAALKLARALGTGVHIGLSATQEELRRLGRCREGALKCANVFFSRPSQEMIRESDEGALINVDPKSHGLMQNCLSALRERSYNGMTQCLAMIQDYLANEAMIEEKYIKYHFMDLCVSALTVCAEETGKPQRHLGLDDYAHISAASSLTDLRDFSEDFLWDLIDIMNDRKAAINPLTRDILEIVRNEYADELRLSDLADRLHATSGYISRLLKRDLNESFLQLLTHTRMTKACELLAQSDLPIGKVAEQIGIPDMRYFSHLFKRQYDLTPNQYRKQNRLGDKA